MTWPYSERAARWFDAASNSSQRIASTRAAGSMAELPLERKLIGLEFDGVGPERGVPLYLGERVLGRVTSVMESPTLGKAIGLGWLRALDGEFPVALRAGETPARVVPTPFYDPEGARLRA